MQKFLNQNVAFILALVMLLTAFVEPVRAQGLTITPALNGGTQSPMGSRKNTQVPSLNNDQEAGTQNMQGGKAQGTAFSSPDQMLSQIRVHVLGEVENPGIYTISVSDRLSDVLAMAVFKRSSQRMVQVRREGEGARFYDLYRYYYEGQLRQNPYLRDNDVVFVPSAKGAVRIEGPVARPGLYELYNEKNLRDVLQLAGGLTSAASTVNPIKIIRFSEGGKKFIVDVENQRRALASTKIMKGDIVVVSDIINTPEKFDYSVETIPGENLFYPTATPNVFVVGSVNQAGPFPYKSHLKVKDYIAYASPTVQARLNTVVRIRAGKKQRMRFDDTPQPGDVLVVKNKVGVGVIVAAISTAMSLILTTLLLESTLKDRL